MPELRSDGPIGEGSEFRIVFMRQGNDVTLAESDRPKGVIVAASNTMMDLDTSYDFTGTHGGTKLVVTTDIGPKGLVSVLSPLLRLYMRHALAKKYETVKKACEGESDPPQG